jgi:hypothetical protein
VGPIDLACLPDGDRSPATNRVEDTNQQVAGLRIALEDLANLDPERPAAPEGPGQQAPKRDQTKPISPLFSALDFENEPDPPLPKPGIVAIGDLSARAKRSSRPSRHKEIIPTKSTT